jgi:hypothetical protein
MSSVKLVAENMEYWVKPEFLELEKTQATIKKWEGLYPGFQETYKENETGFGLELWQNCDLNKYLHNTNGPAIVNTDPGKEDNVCYFIDGNQATPEQIERIKHNDHFNKEFDTNVLK